MVWNSTAPLGTVSVRANLSLIGQNTTYTETTMGNITMENTVASTTDHFWDIDPLLDGHHRYCQFPKFVNGGLPVDPSYGNGIDAIYYAKQKTAIESTAQQDVQPYWKNGIAQIMQVLGIRAMGVFTANTGSNPTQNEVLYSHNLAIQAAGTPGIVRTGTGRFTITFANALPSANYAILGLCMRDSSTVDNDMYMYIPAAITSTDSKSTTRVKIAFKNPGGSHHDPLQAWFVVFGG